MLGKVRLRRTLLGMSQEQLGTELNITSQQVQKYERGANRISASRLWDISQILDVPVSYFFNDMSQDTMKSSPRRVSRAVKPLMAMAINCVIRWRGVKHWNWFGPTTQLKNQSFENVFQKW